MVEKEYAKALFELASEVSKTKEYNDTLTSLATVVCDNEEFVKLLSSPMLPLEQRLAIVEEIFHQAEADILAFLKLLVVKKQISLLKGISQYYTKLLEDANDVLHFDLISSKKLANKFIVDLKRILENRYPNKKLVITEKLDEKVVYGFQLICNGQRIDMSVHNLLDKLKEAL